MLINVGKKIPFSRRLKYEFYLKVMWFEWILGAFQSQHLLIEALPANDPAAP